MVRNNEKLCAWRKLKGWSQEQAAAKFSTFAGHRVAQGTWSPWESGSKSPDRDHSGLLEDFTEGHVRARDWPTRKRKSLARTGGASKRTGTDG